MEKFNVTLTQKSFRAEAENVGANDLKDLADNIAAFAVETVRLHTKLKDAKVLSQNSRIKVGQKMEIQITYLGEDFSLAVSLRNFGRFVMNSTTEQVADAIFSIAEYQEKVGYLFNIAE